MKHTKQELLNDLLSSIEDKVTALQVDEKASYDLDTAIIKGNKVDILAKTAIRIDAATDLMIATQKADQAYRAYLECLRAEREVAANAI